MMTERRETMSSNFLFSGHTKLDIDKPAVIESVLIDFFTAFEQYEDMAAGIGDPFGYLECPSLDNFDKIASLSSSSGGGIGKSNVSVTCGGRKSFVQQQPSSILKKQAKIVNGSMHTTFLQEHSGSTFSRSKLMC
jgi:hypothetical protein